MIIELLPDGPAIRFPRMVLVGVKADLVKQTVRLTIDVPMDDALGQRLRLTDLANAEGDIPAALDIQPLRKRTIHEEGDDFQLTLTVGPGGEVLSETRPADQARGG